MKLTSLIHKPYLYFWFTSLLILAKGLLDQLIYDDPTSVINIHDTYFVIPHLYFAVLCALLYFIGGILYWIFKCFRLFRSLTVIHTLVSILGVIIYPIIIPLIALAEDDISYEGVNIAGALLFFLVSLVQLLFIINLLAAPLRGRKPII
jgi:hypothetical protein